MPRRARQFEHTTSPVDCARSLRGEHLLCSGNYGRSDAEAGAIAGRLACDVLAEVSPKI